MGTIIVSIVVIAIISFSISVMVKDKRKGKSIQCGVDCNKCNHHCH